MYNKLIIKELRRLSKSKVDRLPNGMDFCLVNKTLYVNVKVPSLNMQEDGVAFESWILILKAWLGDLIEKVELSFSQVVSLGDYSNFHFNRFLYRIYNMQRLYPEWFTIDQDKMKYVSGLMNYISNECCLNLPVADRKEIIVHNHRERIVESYFAFGQGRSTISKKWNIDYSLIFNQLPVGVFKDKVAVKNKIFPGGHSAIDIWGIGKDDESLHVIELKYGKNTSVGVISELLFYVSIMYDTFLASKKIFSYDTNNKNNKTYQMKAILEYKNSMKKIHAHLLTMHLHPLFSDKVVDLIQEGLNPLGISFDIERYNIDINSFTKVAKLKTNYCEVQREKAVLARNEIFRDSGNGLFRKHQYPFVLENPNLNLWEGVRKDALSYFESNSIKWWASEKLVPTGHLLSSQVACVNHLFFCRQRKDIATSILSALDADVLEAERVDDGYVEFEFIGEQQYLSEKAFNRGAYCTSVDAAMIGKLKNGERRLYLIEWKYTESYGNDDKYKSERAKVYDSYITDTSSPFQNYQDVKAFYYEPFYQLMRQTLLAEECVKNKDHGISSYKHIHVAPSGNIELLKKITSPYFKGSDIHEAWLNVLKKPNCFKAITPQIFLEPVWNCMDTLSIKSYLEKRYWG